MQNTRGELRRAVALKSHRRNANFLFSRPRIQARDPDVGRDSLIKRIALN